MTFVATTSCERSMTLFWVVSIYHMASASSSTSYSRVNSLQFTYYFPPASFMSSSEAREFACICPTERCHCKPPHRVFNSVSPQLFQTIASQGAPPQLPLCSCHQLCTRDTMRMTSVRRQCSLYETAISAGPPSVRTSPSN